MIIPLHLIPDHQHNALPLYALDGVAVAVDPSLRPQHQLLDLCMPVVGPADPADLQRFQALMAADGLSAQATRMMYDRLYACERLAQGHGSANPALRDLAMHLFNSYQQAGAWIGLVH